MFTQEEAKPPAIDSPPNKAELHGSKGKHSRKRPTRATQTENDNDYDPLSRAEWIAASAEVNTPGNQAMAEVFANFTASPGNQQAEGICNFGLQGHVRTRGLPSR